MIVLEENIEVSDAIRHKAAELAQRVYPDECNVWARGNWEAQNIRVAFECGAVEQRNIDIEKACEVYECELKEVLNLFKIYGEMKGIKDLDEMISLDGCIRDFRKSMEE